MRTKNRTAEQAQSTSIIQKFSELKQIPLGIFCTKLFLQLGGLLVEKLPMENAIFSPRQKRREKDLESKKITKDLTFVLRGGAF